MELEDFKNAIRAVDEEQLKQAASYADAHYAEHVGRGVEEGMALAARCGFRKLTFFQNREPMQLPIE